MPSSSVHVGFSSLTWHWRSERYMVWPRPSPLAILHSSFPGVGMSNVGRPEPEACVRTLAVGRLANKPLQLTGSWGCYRTGLMSGSWTGWLMVIAGLISWDPALEGWSGRST